MNKLSVLKVQSTSANSEFLPVSLSAMTKSFVNIDSNQIIESKLSGLLVEMGSRRKPDLAGPVRVLAPGRFWFGDMTSKVTPLSGYLMGNTMLGIAENY